MRPTDIEGHDLSIYGAGNYAYVTWPGKAQWYKLGQPYDCSTAVTCIPPRPDVLRQLDWEAGQVKEAHTHRTTLGGLALATVITCLVIWWFL